MKHIHTSLLLLLPLAVVLPSSARIEVIARTSQFRGVPTIPGQAAAGSAGQAGPAKPSSVPGTATQTAPGLAVHGQAVSGQTVPGQTAPGQAVPGPGQAAVLPGAAAQPGPGQAVTGFGQASPGQAATRPGEGLPGQTGEPGKPSAVPGAAAQTLPGLSQPGPGQMSAVPGTPSQTIPGQLVAANGVANGAAPGIGVPTLPGQAVPAPSPAVSTSSQTTHAVSTAAQATNTLATPADGATGSVAVTGLTTDTAATTVSASYVWSVVKRFSNQATTQELTVPVGGSGMATYQIVVTKSMAAQSVTVVGTFSVAGSGMFSTPSVAFVPAPASTPTGTVTCSPANTAPASCSFHQTWTDSSITAAVGGTVTVSVGGSTASAAYNFASSPNGVTGKCAVVNDQFAAGQLTSSNMQVTGNRPPANIQLCDSGDTIYEYSITFSNMQSSWCSSGVTAVNTVTVTPLGGGATVSAAATAKITVTGCTGSGSTSVTVGDLKTTVINTYTWALDKTGGGGSLTTTPDQELTIPFTITATQTLTSAVGYVAGTISIQNTIGSITITAIQLNVGSTTKQLVLSNCAATTVSASASTSCTFNETAPNAPAAGSVTATVTYTATGASSASTASSTAASYAFTAAETYNLGGTANLYDTIDSTGLSTVSSTVTGVNSMVRLSPPDAAPPTSSPGVTLSGSRTFTYSMIISRLLTCSTGRTVTNTATLTPVGSSQGVLSKAASATFSVTGCNVLPTVALSNVQLWSAVTWSWSLTKTASPNSYQLPVGSAGQAQYQVQLTRTRSTGNYFMSGQLTINNPASFPMYISSVTLMSTTGQFGALPPVCLGGSNVGGSTISTGVTDPWGNTGMVNPFTGNFGTSTGSFAIGAGAQIQCVFNVSAGTGAAPQGTVYAQATTTSTYVGSSGNTAISSNVPVDFSQPTQQWDIGGCVTFSDNAITQGSAGAWAPQLTGLPQQQRICDSRTLPYAGTISAVPMTGAICSQAVTIANTATAMPDGGPQPQSATATISVTATGCAANSPAAWAPPVLPPTLPPPAPPSTGRGGFSSTPLTAAVQPGIDVMAVGGYEWSVSVTSDADARGAVAVPVGSSRAVRYTVTARRKSAINYYVSGWIKVSNPTDSVLTASSVVAQLPMGTVPAACPGGRFPVQVPAMNSINCLFNASLSEAAPGSVSAFITTSTGSSTSDNSVQYAMTAAPKAPTGTCAVLSDTLTSDPAMPSGSASVDGNLPPGSQTKPVCEDSSYSYTATFGPYSDTACNTYLVTAVATATPTDGYQGQATGQNKIQVKADGCSQTMQSVESVSVVATRPTGRSSTSYRWSASTDSSDRHTMNYQSNLTLAFNVSWSRVDAFTSRISGALVVSNPTKEKVYIKSASALPDFTDGADPMPGTGPVIAADCKDTTLAPGASTNCTYFGTVPGGGKGSLVGEVLLSNGRTVSSDSTSFKLQSAQGKGVAMSAGCAEIVTGLLLSPALLLPNRTVPNTADQIKACESGSKLVYAQLGPFGEDGCGQYAVVLTTRVQPSSSSGQLPFASVGTALVNVTGCPLGDVPAMEAVVPADVNVSSIVRIPWNVSTTSDSPDPLQVEYDTPQEVTVRVDVRKSDEQRSVAVQGFVQISAQGGKRATVDRVKVAALQQRGDLTIIDATCPPDSVQNGSIVVPASPNKLTCSFRIADLPPMDGALTPLIYVGKGSETPLPATATVYRVANAPRVTLGGCATIGVDRSLKPEGSDYSLEGQPSADVEIPSTPVCRDYSTRYSLTFGPFKADQCGRYNFASDLSAKAYNSTQAVRDSLTFAVDVTGCKASNRKASNRKSSNRGRQLRQAHKVAAYGQRLGKRFRWI